MDKLLVICGPTATGKTKLGIHLAKKFNGEIVSADSRQVYCGMNIGTGKDLPKAARSHIVRRISKTGNVAYYLVNGVRIWGYDLADPKKSFSVSQYVRFAQKIIADIFLREKLPIVVGGTGLYIKALVDGIETIAIKQNRPLRKSLIGRGRGELFETLSNLDPIRAASLNFSDKQNPRRLIRAIEIADARIKGKRGKVKGGGVSFDDVLFIGLTTGSEELKNVISKRVSRRIRGGMEKEVVGLVDSGVSWGSQSMSSLGYGVWGNYFAKKVSIVELKHRWSVNELAYAKRQKTWFKRDKRINWFDISGIGWKASVEKKVSKWYKRK